MTAPGGPRQAFLPGRAMTKLERARMPRVLPPPSSSASWVPPLSVTELEALRLVADGWEHFDVKERSIAGWLRENDVHVVSVQRSQVSAQRITLPFIGQPEQPLGCGDQAQLDNGRVALQLGETVDAHDERQRLLRVRDRRLGAAAPTTR